MRYIQKNRPQDFLEAIAPVVPPSGDQTGAYDSFSKQSLKAFLSSESHDLCAYCQRSIKNGVSAIEHYLPQSLNPELALTYTNLYAVCLGTDYEKKPFDLFCSVVRRNELFSWSPLVDPNCKIQNSLNFRSSNLYYKVNTFNGHIQANSGLDSQTRDDIESFIRITHLNHNKLKRFRAAFFAEWIQEFYLKNTNVLTYIDLINSTYTMDELDFHQFILTGLI